MKAVNRLIVLETIHFSNRRSVLNVKNACHPIFPNRRSYGYTIKKACCRCNTPRIVGMLDADYSLNNSFFVMNGCLKCLLNILKRKLVCCNGFHVHQSGGNGGNCPGV